MTIADEKCRPYKPGEPPLKKEETRELAKQIPHWTLREKEIERELQFKGFLEAMDFVNEVAAVAQAADHHPDICINYNKVKLNLSTHSIGGLSRNDFIIAAKIDRI